jgi:NAD(P)-dependent dehydrogenase (short-subunit alcohol dehydrogenase family)
MTGDLSGRTTLVVGASRGLGRGIAAALSEAGAPVVAVARTVPEIPGLVAAEAADGTDAAAARRLLDRHDPRAVVLVAGATPVLRPLQDQTWETFSINWHADVRIAFTWLGEILRRPLPPGGRVVVVSSGAALAGSPLSGGYAGAKATIRFISAYAAAESERSALGIRFISVLPQLTPATELGAAGAAAYAARQGVDIATFLKGFGPALTPERAGKAIVDLVADPGDQESYSLTAAGLSPVA